MFCRALPENVRAALTTAKTKDTKEMALIADNIQREYRIEDKTDSVKDCIFSVSKNSVTENKLDEIINKLTLIEKDNKSIQERLFKLENLKGCRNKNGYKTKRIQYGEFI